MFTHLKNNIADKKLGIKETIHGHIEQFVKLFKRHYGDTLTSTEGNEWIIDSFVAVKLSEQPLPVTEEFLDVVTKAAYYKYIKF